MELNPEQAKAVVAEIATLDPRLFELAVANINLRAMSDEIDSLKKIIENSKKEADDTDTDKGIEDGREDN